MNAPFRTPAANHPEIPDGSACRPWHVVLRPFMGGWEPVIIAGEALAFNYPNLARAAARGYPGATDRFMGYSPSRPTVEAVRKAVNPEDLGIGGTGTMAIDDMDSWKLAQSPYRHGGR